MKKKILSMFMATGMFVLCSCGENVSADELTEYYSNKAADVVVETAEKAASKVNEEIESNEVTSGIKKGVTTAGEYAQDGYEYLTDENTIGRAKDGAKAAKDDTINFFDYFYFKIQDRWNDVVVALETPPSELPHKEYKYEDLSEYDALGDFTNPFLEAKGIDTSADGTLIEQLRKFVNKTTDDAKVTANNIKENHDAKHTSKEESSENRLSKIEDAGEAKTAVSNIILDIVPEYSTNPYCIINSNTPFFEVEDITTKPFIALSELDSLGRCGVAYMNASRELAPTEERGSIGSIKPSGWNQAKYDILKDENDNPQGYLMCRMHLLAYTLSGLNAEERNLISGTFYANVDGMEPFELAISRYVKSTGNHVLYRVTPIYRDNELIARGVLMEAKSVEDDKLSFCVYVYNVAPGITLNYADGSSHVTR